MSSIPNKTWLDPRVEIRNSDVAGQGSFANAPIQAGEIVIRWGGGVIVTEEEFQKGFAEGKYQPETAIHFDENHKWVQLAAEPDINDASLNHSCNPNLWFTDGWAFAAKRDIAVGEELTFDYATGETYPLHGECQCGSANCRKHVTGKEWESIEFQNEYKGHFSPYIQGLINKKSKLF